MTVVCRMSLASLVLHTRFTLVTWHISDSSIHSVDNSLISERGQRFVVSHQDECRTDLPFIMCWG
jgi:hypothetical protein